MKTWLQQPRTMAVLVGLLLTSALRGIPPRENRVPHLQPSGPADRGGQVTIAPQAQVPTQAPAQAPAPSQRAGSSQRSVSPIRPRVNRVYIYPGTRTVVPPGWVRCSTLPDLAYWGHRDLMAEIQWLSRTGFIPVSPVGDRVDILSDYVQVPAGWRAYGISVPVGGTVQVEVQHTKLGWFRLMMVDKWGSPGAGMLQQLVTPQPVLLTYKNPGKEATAIYVIVDDPAWWSDAKDPYTLLVRRDWDPARTDLSQVKMVAGLWGATPSVSAEFRGPSLSGPAVFPH